jgi:thiamine-phosphate pyrophosphorylase
MKLMNEISRLHCITQDLENRTHAEQAELACEGGSKWIQVRIKNSEAADQKRMVLECLSVCEKHGAKLIVNDNALLAAASGAAGVHLGKTDMPVETARKILGPKAIIGATANTFEDIQAILLTSADYIGLGPFRFTETKANLSPVLGAEGYLAILQKLSVARIPIIAIGGIQIADVQLLMQSGLDGIAVSSAINLSPDPAETTRAFIRAIEKSGQAAKAMCTK